MRIESLYIGQRVLVVGHEPWVSDWRDIPCEIAGLLRRNKGSSSHPLWVDEVMIRDMENGAVFDGFSVDNVIPA